jgi:D-inositol-3-phosphate glycosyltransferase
MRILVVSHLALPHVGGVENLVDLEIRGLEAAGHEVVLVTSDGTGAGRIPTYPPTVRTVRVRAWHGPERRLGIPYPVSSPHLLSVLWREVGLADVVHAHGFMFMHSALAVALARLRGKPCVLTDHGGIQRFGSSVATLLARLGAETVGRLSATLATRVVTYNSRIQATLNRLGRRRDAECVPNPVDQTFFFPPTASERAAARASLGWLDARPRVLFVGRLIPAKGVPLLMSAAGTDFDLVFCGPGDPTILGPLPRLGVEYLPPRPQDQLRRIYHAADALVLPAEVREGFPLVVQEAIACGLPVVLGHDPGFSPYRGLPGLVMCDRTPDAVRVAIRQALAAGVTLARTGKPHPAEFFPTLGRWVQILYPPLQPATSAGSPGRPEVCLAPHS